MENLWFYVEKPKKVDSGSFWDNIENLGSRKLKKSRILGRKNNVCLHPRGENHCWEISYTSTSSPIVLQLTEEIGQT